MKICTMLNVIKFAPICMTAVTNHSCHPWVHCTFLHNKSSSLTQVFHADELSWMLCNITQSVKWLLGSPGYHSSNFLRGIGMGISGNIWFCSYHNILPCLSSWGCRYCLESSAGSLVLLASRQLREFSCLSRFEALLEKALLSSISPLKAVVSYPLQLFGLMVKFKGMLESYLLLAGMQS